MEGTFQKFKSKAQNKGSEDRGLGVRSPWQRLGLVIVFWQLREGGVLKVLTNKLDSFVEPGADICFVVVLDWNTFVQERVLKVVWAVGRDVDECCDP